MLLFLYMNEKSSISPDIIFEKAIDCQQQIASILQDKNPIDKIHSIVSISYIRLKKEVADDLLGKLNSDTDQQDAKVQLLYYSLPTVDSVIQKYKKMGESQEDLVSLVFKTQLRFFNKLKDNPLENSSLLKSCLNRYINTDLQNHFCSQHDIDIKLFPFLPVFYQIKDDFEQSCGRLPSLKDWPALKEDINQHLQRLPAEDQQFFQKYRYRIYPSEWNEKSREDVFYLVAKKAFGGEEKTDLISSYFGQEKIANQINIQDIVEAVRQNLDARDIKILDYLAEGYTKKEIASLVGVSHSRPGQIIRKIEKQLKKAVPKNLEIN